MIFQVAERFKSIQGEGLYAGTPMAFIRFVGCSVGKKVCQHCDTDFDKPLWQFGGGSQSIDDLLIWMGEYEHICLTGGEPFDQPQLHELVEELHSRCKMVHIESSGTVFAPVNHFTKKPFLTICPKPGWHREMVDYADEVKVIVPSLGNGPGWPTIEDALRWVEDGKIVFLQPRNGKYDIDHINLKACQDLIAETPAFRLSVQLHKLLRVR